MLCAERQMSDQILYLVVARKTPFGMSPVSIDLLSLSTN